MFKKLKVAVWVFAIGSNGFWSGRIYERRHKEPPAAPASLFADASHNLLNGLDNLPEITWQQGDAGVLMIVQARTGLGCRPGMHDVAPYAIGLVCGRDGMTTSQLFDAAKKISDEEIGRRDEGVRARCCVGANCPPGVGAVPYDCPEIDDI